MNRKFISHKSKYSVTLLPFLYSRVVADCKYKSTQHVCRGTSASFIVLSITVYDFKILYD